MLGCHSHQLNRSPWQWKPGTARYDRDEGRRGTSVPLTSFFVHPRRYVMRRYFDDTDLVFMKIVAYLSVGGLILALII
jgi:hypothetical protein